MKRSTPSSTTAKIPGAGTLGICRMVLKKINHTIYDTLYEIHSNILLYIYFRILYEFVYLLG